MAVASGTDKTDSWNWPEMMFCARKFLYITSEAEFWHMRPRTYFALLAIAIKYKSAAATNSEAPGIPPMEGGMTTIDNIPGFD